MELKGKTIVLGVTGGIAAYWASEIIGVLRNHEADVHVIMTKNATRFITPLTLQTLSKNKVVSDMFNLPVEPNIEHITYAKNTDLILVAPATANIIGKVANGIADNMLSTTIMATTAPIVFCPAMNEKMWENPIVQENVKKLKEHGYYFVNSEYGKMACGGIGGGKLASIDSIINKLKDINKKWQKKKFK